MQQNSKYNEAVSISASSLVHLKKYSSLLAFKLGHIMASKSGDYQSPFKGRGMEFDESRLYQPGDDIRNIDWRVTARTGKTHTKLFREERERPIYLWVDLRASMFFATRGMFKSVMASKLASLVAWSAEHHGDRIGGVIFSETLHYELRPHRGKTGVLRFIKKLVDHPAWQDPYSGDDKMAISKALIRMRRIARPGSMIFLMSDFRYLNEKSEKQLIRLSKHNDITLFYISDPFEQALPPAGQYRVSDGEKEIAIETYNKDKIERYRNKYIEHSERLVRISKMNNVNLISCATYDDPLEVLKSHFLVRS